MKMENLPDLLKEQLAGLPDDLTPLARFNAAIEIIEDYSNQFKELLTDEAKADVEYLISAYKIVKPEIDAHRIEEGLRYSLIVNKPIDRPDKLIAYFEEHLETLAAFLRMNAFYYQYFKCGFNELDHIYFLPDGNQKLIPLPEPPELYSVTSTPMSYLFAKFIAYERLQYYILHQIDLIEKRPESLGFSIKEAGSSVLWTGDIVNLVEIAYGLWLTGQINNGNASLGQIVKWLENSLSVNMGNVQKKFAEIESRKRISTTRYLDQMIQAINLRAEQDLLR